MDTQAIIHSFTHSSKGRQAEGALRDAGFEASQISQILHHAARAGIEHIEQDASNGGILGEHAGMSFFAAFASGLIKGDGVVGSLEDGAAGIVVGRITEALTSAIRLDSGLADAAAAATAPYVVAYLKKHLGILEPRPSPAPEEPVLLAGVVRTATPREAGGKRMVYKLIAVLGFPRNVLEFILCSRNVATCLTGNEYFPACPVPSSALTPLVDALDVAAQAAHSGAAGTVQERKYKRELVEQAIKLDCAYVQSVVSQAPPALGAEMLATSGFGQKLPSTHRKDDYTVTRGLVTGDVVIDVRAQGRHGTVIYFHQHSIDAGQTWLDEMPTLDTRIVVTGLPVGVTVWFQYRALVQSVYNWSDVRKLPIY